MSSCSIPDRLKTFNVSNWQPEANKPARYSHGELGYFSIDEEGYFWPNDKSKLHTLDLPQDCKNTDIDLNEGFEQWKDLPKVKRHLDSMLQWILLDKDIKESLTITDDFRLNVDFITTRGSLAGILNVLSENVGGKFDKWTLLATRYKGTVYLSHIEDDPDKTDKELPPYMQKVYYWGKRFEVEITKAPTQATPLPGSFSTPPPENEVERHGPFDAYPGFYSVVRFELEDHRIALRAEIDAQREDEQQIPPSTNYVELKVATQNIISAPQIFNQKRLVPSWCQSIVSGTPLIVYGIRDEDGHVKSIEQVKTDDIPDRVGQKNLNKDKYLLFLSEMLSWIKSIVCAEGVAAVYEFQWDSNAPGRGVTATALHAANSFLPEWYVDEMEDYFMRKQWQSPHTSEEDISEDYDGESSSLLAEELFDRQSSRYSPDGRRRKRTDKTIR